MLYSISSTEHHFDSEKYPKKTTLFEKKTEIIKYSRKYRLDKIKSKEMYITNNSTHTNARAKFLCFTQIARKLLDTQLLPNIEILPLHLYVYRVKINRDGIVGIFSVGILLLNFSADFN